MKNRKLWVSVIAGALVVVMLLSLIIGILPRNANALTSDELKTQLEGLQAEKDAITAQMEELEQQQSANREDMEGIIAQKEVIDQQVALLYAEITNVNEQIAAYSLLIADKQVELEESQAQLDELTAKNKERLRAMEEEGELNYWSVIFKASSFSDLLDRVHMVKEIAEADKRRLDEMGEAAETVMKTQQELATEKAALEETKEELEQTQITLDEKNAEADALLAELVAAAEDMDALHSQFEAEEEEYLDQIASKEKEYNKKLAEEKEASRQASILASSIEASIQESIEESRQQATATTAPPTSSSNSGDSGNSGNSGDSGDSDSGDSGNSDSGNSSSTRWLSPCSYRKVSSPFGYRWHPVTGEYSMHKGVDLDAAKGTPIYASRSGYVTVAKYHYLSGNYVTINHQDGYSSTYLHMTHYVVGVGDYVKAGQVIGYVGSTGRSTGPHLHFGIMKNGVYVNPMDYI